MTLIRAFCVPSLGLASGLALLAGLAAPPAVAQEAEDAAPPPVVTVAPAAEREMVQLVPVSGTLIPADEVLVYPEIGGYRITGLHVEVGDRVEVGQVIARLDDDALRSRLSQAEAGHQRAAALMRQAQDQIASTEATLTRASDSLDRAKLLHESGTATQASLDEATASALTAEAALSSAQSGFSVAAAQYLEAEADLDLARLDLAHAEIAAPVSGVVSARSGQVGAIAASGGEPIFRIIRDGEVEVEAEVIETELGVLSPGDPVELDVAGLGPVAGSVRLISPVVDPASRLGSLRIALEAREGLRPGLFAGGWVEVDRRRALAVPASAVITVGEDSHVLRVVDGVIEQRAVVAGLLWQDWREVVEGLEPGDQVVARAGAFFGDGDRVRPLAADDAAEGSE